MGKFELYYDFMASKRKATKLENQAKQIRRIANNSLNSDTKKLKKYWEGEACNSFINKGDKLVIKANKIAQSLEESARTIRTVAERTYRAELKALELAKTRSHK